MAAGFRPWFYCLKSRLCSLCLVKDRQAGGFGLVFMRGISVLQRAIIRIAYQHRQRAESNQADLFFYQFVVEYFFKATRAEDKPDPDRQHFTRKKVGRRRYQRTMTSLSRAVTRLEERGLVRRVKVKGCQWTGLSLTSKGLAMAENGI